MMMQATYSIRSIRALLAILLCCVSFLQQAAARVSELRYEASKATVSAVSTKETIARLAIVEIIKRCPDTWRLVLDYMQAHKTTFQIDQAALAALRSDQALSIERKVQEVMPHVCTKMFWVLEKPTLSSSGEIALTVLCCRRPNTHDDGIALVFHINNQGIARPMEYTDGWKFKDNKDTFEPYNHENSLLRTWNTVRLIRPDSRGDLLCDVAINNYNETGGTIIQGCWYNEDESTIVHALKEAAAAVAPAKAMPKRESLGAARTASRSRSF